MPTNPNVNDVSVASLTNAIAERAAALPHDEVVLAAGALTAAADALATAGSEHAATLDGAHQAAASAGGHLASAAESLESYTAFLGARSSAAADRDAVPDLASPVTVNRPLSAEILASADAAQQRLESLPYNPDGVPEKDAYTGALEGLPDDVLCELYRRRVPGTIGVLVRRHIRYIWQQSFTFIPRLKKQDNGVEREDLVAAGVDYFMNGALRYNGGAKLLSYLGKGLHGAMLSAFNQERYIVRLSGGIDDSIVVKIRQENFRRSAEGRQPITDSEIAEMFNIPLVPRGKSSNAFNARLTVADVRQACALTHELSSLDAPAKLKWDTGPDGQIWVDRPLSTYTDYGAVPLAGSLVPGPEAVVEQQDMPKALQEALASLTFDEYYLVTSRYPLDGSPPKTNEALAREMYCSHTHVSNIVLRALRKIRERYPDLALYLQS